MKKGGFYSELIRLYCCAFFICIVFVFILYRQQVYENPIIDGVETIKPINRHSTHTDHIKAKSLGYGGYHTELINIVTHF